MTKRRRRKSSTRFSKARADNPMGRGRPSTKREASPPWWRSGIRGSWWSGKRTACIEKSNSSSRTSVRRAKRTGTGARGVSPGKKSSQHAKTFHRAEREEIGTLIYAYRHESADRQIRRLLEIIV